jgi:formate dehydrogenase
MEMAKILCVLYDDPVDGYSAVIRARRDPENRTLSRRPDRRHSQSDRLCSRNPARQCVGRTGLAKIPRGFGHTFVVTRDKEGPNSVFERELPDADIVISQLFWPAYLTAEDREGAKTEVINSCTPASEPIPAVIASNSDYRNDLETHELFASDVMPRFA